MHLTIVNVLSAGVPYLSIRNRTHCNRKLSSQQEVPDPVHLSKTDILSAGGTVHMTRVLSTGGTGAVHIKAVIVL